MPEKIPEQMTTNDYLHEIFRSQKKQERMQRTRMAVQIITSVAALALVAILVTQFVPLVTPLVKQIDGLTTTVNELAGNTNMLVKELNATDLGGTVKDARDGIATASASMEAAAENISKVDFEALNKSVLALSAVVDAMAAIFGR